ncbi:MAG: hypothetical protein V7L29_16520 [Nostoc sp.]|uniref:hypothetical protein n=1 Tax=Nostoc sp. TaxID=1180 RepID=UPI002FF7178E
MRILHNLTIAVRDSVSKGEGLSFAYRNRFLTNQTTKPTIIPTIRLELKGLLQKQGISGKISFILSLLQNIWQLIVVEMLLLLLNRR